MDEIERHLIDFLRVPRDTYQRFQLTRVVVNVCECAQLTLQTLKVYDDPFISPLSFTSALTIAPLCEAAAHYISRTTRSIKSPNEIKLELEGLVGGWLLESQPRQQDYSQTPAAESPFPAHDLQPVAQP